MRPSQPLAAVLGLSMFMTTAGASAQTERDRYDYMFVDDDLVGDTLNTPPPLLRVPVKGRKVMLLRPRVSFLPELLHSIETS